MHKKISFQIAALLLGGALALPPALPAAEKDNMMKDDAGKTMKEAKGGMMKEGKAGATKQDNGKANKDADKMKMDKMEEKKM